MNSQITTLTESPGPTNTLVDQNSTVATINAKVAFEMTVLPDCGSPLNHNYSMDGNWVAMECVDYGMGVYNLKDFSKSWFFSYFDTFGLKYENGNHFGRLKPKHWSDDGKYLYFVPFFGGDGGCMDYAEGRALFRLDLSSGKYSETLSPDEKSFFYNFSFSNNDKYLAYFETSVDHPILKLNHLSSNMPEEIIPLSKKYSGAGYLIWSEDNTHALFSARSGQDCEAIVYYLIWMNLKDRTQKVIFEGEKIKYFPVTMIDENTALLQAGFSEEYYYINMTSGEISPVDQFELTSVP